MRYEGVSCGLATERPAAGIVLVRLTGWDTGEFGDAPMREIATDFGAGAPLELFIDARAVPFVQLTAKFVRRSADLGEIMRIYTDARAFEAALQAATAR